jgi:hypothetical protein
VGQHSCALRLLAPRRAGEPDGKSVHVTNNGSSNVSQYDVGAGGALQPKTPATIAAGTNPRGGGGAARSGTAGGVRIGRSPVALKGAPVAFQGERFYSLAFLSPS